MAQQQRLEALLLAALKQAMQENRLDVADHILKALETLDATGEQQAIYYREVFFEPYENIGPLPSTPSTKDLRRIRH